ncbi:hypothetical protein N7676_00300 [Stenotrophomonas sp. GD03993]|uniref:hypothetical protein n=1 Tax=unclassified Stenotrophomonas TaxID=196198 RepID=UPI00244CD3F4|nr:MULTISPECIES: hypothetical protein [unclassified Stenotrophomonas]MDH0185886.1 hypothetical protein [Stenotrophomonas sp. GD04051]MDH0462252.1 hypothetical protein [Stenotrophomonas sp. GD03993]MDH0875055.1 hypothetical protein [Stenotrophomonas sp. GD03877]MDH2154669.1 hypothetical protein [Stenotrophomonas sp. GD03657]
MDWVLIISAASTAGNPPGVSGGVAWGALVGVVLGWALKAVSDFLLERQRRRDAADARREKRFDELRSRRIEAERSNLLALQPMVTDFMVAGAICSRAPRCPSDGGDLVGEEFEEKREAMRAQAAAMMAIRARLHDREIAELAGRLTAGGLHAVQQAFTSDSTTYWETFIPIARDLHNEVGAAIRRLEDESIQIVAPPSDG